MYGTWSILSGDFPAVTKTQKGKYKHCINHSISATFVLLATAQRCVHAGTLVAGSKQCGPTLTYG